MSSLLEPFSSSPTIKWQKGPPFCQIRQVAPTKAAGRPDRLSHRPMTIRWWSLWRCLDDAWTMRHPMQMICLEHSYWGDYHVRRLYWGIEFEYLKVSCRSSTGAGRCRWRLSRTKRHLAASTIYCRYHIAVYGSRLLKKPDKKRIP